MELDGWVAAHVLNIFPDCETGNSQGASSLTGTVFTTAQGPYLLAARC